MSDPPATKKPKMEEDTSAKPGETQVNAEMLFVANNNSQAAVNVDEEAIITAAAHRVVPDNYIPGIQPATKHDEKWNEMFYRLQEFRQLHNHAAVPQKYPQDIKLGRWVHYQRVEFWLYTNRGQGKITPERIDCLEKVGFEWDPQRANWNNMYNRLVKYKERCHHVQVPKGYKEDVELANWVRNQRLEYSNKLRGRKHRMTDERQAKLEQLGFTWSGAVVAQGLVVVQQAAQQQADERGQQDNIMVTAQSVAGQDETHQQQQQQQEEQKVDESIITEEDVAAAVHAATTATEQGVIDAHSLRQV
jgi:hypothetical protein